MALLSPRFNRLLKSNEPLLAIIHRGSPDTKSLIIFLPGIDDVAEDFERRGFIEDMRRHGIAADAVAVDAHYGYYASRAIHARIAEDVIAAARSSGYEQIWLAGISLGGFGAATYAALNASHIDGLLLFAPYLGDSRLVHEITSAGGVRTWEPGVVLENDYQRNLWAWIKSNDAKRGLELPTDLPIYLGYGQSDRFEPAHALLAALLPASRVYAIPGGHDWRTWKHIWKMILPEWAATPC
jgi:pimeloyl-ACP methyl ester carboxylesterase